MFSLFRNKPKIIVWGHPLHSHTHSYIHHGFARAFRHLGYKVYWFEDKPKRFFNFSNSIFLTEGQVDKHIPLVKNAKYILHNCDATRYEAVGASVLRLQVYSNKFAGPPGCDLEGHEKIGYAMWSKPNERILFQPWATDLLPHEIDKLDLIMPDSEREMRSYWVGTLGGGIFGNCDELERFSTACRESEVEFLEAAKHVDTETNIDFIRRSYLAPAIQGPWQLENDYIPCRIFKNISYGHLGMTNSKAVYDLFEGQITYNADCYQLFEDGERDFDRLTAKERESVKCFVKEKHTYLNRIDNILKMF